MTSVDYAVTFLLGTCLVLSYSWVIARQDYWSPAIVQAKPAKPTSKDIAEGLGDWVHVDERK